MLIQAVLNTERYHLRPLTYADAGAIFAYAANPQVAEKTGWHAHQSIEDSECFIARAFELKASGESLIWGISPISAGCTKNKEAISSLNPRDFVIFSKTEALELSKNPRQSNEL